MKIISAKHLKDLLNEKNVFLIDVREAWEHEEESIPGSHLIPLETVSIQHLPLSANKIVAHCKTGKRSSLACKKLEIQNPNLEIYTLEGGIEAWKQEGFSTKKHPNLQLSINQQTQLIIGIFILSGTLLGHFISSLFYFIPGLLGCGLIFASLSGTCLLAKLLTKMPWNLP